MAKSLQDIFEGNKVGISSQSAKETRLSEIFSNKDLSKVKPDFVQDIKETGQSIAENFKSAAAKLGEGIERQREGEQSLGSTILQAFGRGAGAAAQSAGDVFIGAGKALLPERTEQKISNKFESAVGRITDFKQIQNAFQSFEELKQENPEKAANIESLLGIASLALEAATAGSGGAVVGTAKSALTRGASALTGGAADVASSVVKIPTKIARRASRELSGALTGTSGETIQEAFEATLRGGDSAKAFQDTLRGRVTPEKLATDVNDAISETSTRNSKAYKDSLSVIGDEVVDTKDVLNSFENLLNDFGIKIKDENLDFSGSKFKLVSEPQQKIQTAYSELKRISESGETINSIDTTRQALRELKLAGTDNTAKSANKLIDDAIASVRNTVKNPEYKKLLDEFGDNAEFISDLQKDLSSGKKKTIDQTYRRIITSLKTNNERRLRLLRQLDEAVGGTLIPKIAGQQLSEELPRGILRAFAASMAGASIAAGLSGLSAPLIIGMLMASPRITGELVNALGIGARKAKVMIDSIKKVQKTLSETYNIPEDQLYKLFETGAISSVITELPEIESTE